MFPCPKTFLGSSCDFPPELIEYGLSPEVLCLTLEKLQLGENVYWKLSCTPTIGFYPKLHAHLTHHLIIPKVLIGRLLCC